ncbi:MAG: RluA family pseudouridine synthase [Burkholderiaceae bacterium]|nr:RluA family pseudouridine synthase [Burkholderiaceae bacterium]
MATVGEDDGAGQRLDNFLLRHYRNVPKSHLYRLIRSGQVRINGSRCHPDDRLVEGDRVRIPPIQVPEPAAGSAVVPGVVAPPLSLPVLFEDEVLLVVDKPEGLAVHGGSGVAHGVIERLRAARPQSRFLELAHRIDRETSGVLVLSKKRQALVSLHAQWRERVTGKRYLAIVRGRWPLRTKTLNQPLQRYLTPEGERRVCVHAEGQEAISRVTGVRRLALPALGEFTLVRVDIETGRTHQIRVHLAHAGFPILGDDKYGDFPLNRQLTRLGHRRMFLHAAELDISHPVGGRRLRLISPTPQAFEAFMSSAQVGPPQTGADNGADTPDAAQRAGRAHEKGSDPATDPRPAKAR